MMNLGLLLVTAALASAPTTTRVAAAGFAPAGGLSAESANFFSEHFATSLGRERGFEVTTQGAVSSLLGLERQRELLGCANTSSSCLAELVGALGVELLLVGEVAKLDHSLQANVRFLDVATGRAVHVVSVRAATQEGLLDALTEAAHGSALVLRGQREPPSRWPAIATASLGGVALVVGAVFLGFSATAWTTLKAPASPTLGPDAARALARDADLNQWLGVGLATGGALLLASGLIWFAATGSPPQVALFVTPAGGALSFAWELP